MVLGQLTVSIFANPFVDPLFTLFVLANLVLARRYLGSVHICACNLKNGGSRRENFGFLAPTAQENRLDPKNSPSSTSMSTFNHEKMNCSAFPNARHPQFSAGCALRQRPAVRSCILFRLAPLSTESTDIGASGCAQSFSYCCWWLPSALACWQGSGRYRLKN